MWSYSVDLLDCFLADVIRMRHPHCSESERALDNRDIDDILRTSDFLFGSSLDGALALIDGDPTQEITQLVSLISKQSVYLVKSPHRRNSITRRAQSVSCYLCMLPEKSRTDVTAVYGESSLYFCSCRSFFERCRTVTAGPVLCKHLLAIKLAAILKIEYPILGVNSEKEYSELIIQHISLH
jgi:predicted nucleic acid-binding Zn finger protein